MCVVKKDDKQKFSGNGVMKLSIIVPVYGVEKYIEQCISSLLVPDCCDYEIIIVNDGTKDRSMDIVREKFNDTRIRIIEQDNAGLSAARNHGIREAKGEYVWVFDSDDWAEKDLLPELIGCLNNEDVICLDRYYRNYDISGVQILEIHENTANSGIDFLCGDYVQPAQFYVMKSQFIRNNNINFKEGILHEDSLFTPITLTLAENIRTYSNPIYHYRQREGSITQKATPKRLYDLMFVIDALIKFAENKIDGNKRTKWGKCIAQLTNEVLYVAQSCCDENAKNQVRKYVNKNSDLLYYLYHTGIRNKIMSILAKLCFGNLWGVYRVLYSVRY